MSNDVYNEEYYHSHCGIPYHRGEPHWYEFFRDVARGIRQTVGPRTVFDAGCAMGFLVEALRDQGIEAYGRDLSNYAIAQVPPGLKAYVECGSISDPIQGAFDLVTCIEVVEHMEPDQGRRAIENICKISNKVLFSSTHSDFIEETHINVQPPIYWLRIFADYGFGPVSGFDGSFLCPWAILFERRDSRPTDSELEAQADLVLARTHTADALTRAGQQHQDHLTRLTEDIERRHQDQLKLLSRQNQEQEATVRQLQASLAGLLEQIDVQSNPGKGSLRSWRLSRKKKSGSSNLGVQEAAIRQSGLFDVQWYLSTYPDVAAASLDALHHYVAYGAAEGRKPNPVFDTSYYVRVHPQVQASGLNPLYHYLTIGAASGLKPAEDFDPHWYRETYPDAVGDGCDPLLHYLHHGQAEGRRSHGGDSGAAVTQASLVTVKMPASTEELVLFVTHAPGGQIKSHVAVYVDALRRLGLAVCVVVAADDIECVATDALLDHVDGLFVRENGGFDFAAWAHAVREIDLSETRLLVLANDSVIGPVNTAAMQAVVDRIRASSAHLIGLTDNHEIRHHVQSYFLAAKGAGIPFLITYLAEVRSFRHKQDVISCYETTLMAALNAQGLTSEVLFPTDGTTNPTTTRWRELIDEGFPFIKLEVVRTCDPEAWKKTLTDAGFDVRIAEETLAVLCAGTARSSDPAQTLNLAQTQPAPASLGTGALDRTAWLEQEITRARRWPWKLFEDKIKFKIYSAAAKFFLPLSAKLSEKYADKARRRHPKKYLSGSVSMAVVQHDAASEVKYHGGRPHDPAKGNVLVISHQASRTGAPILALNIAQQLSERYNVVSICMSGGDLMQDFAGTSSCAYDAGIYSMNPDDYTSLLERVCRGWVFDFAVVNSVEAHALLKGLRDHGVPTVALLHEFAAYTQDKGAFHKAVGWADEAVFSSQVTLQNALDTGSIYMSPRVHVHPQGRCIVPALKTDRDAVRAEQMRLRNVFRPASASPDRFVVLGAGTVEMRKGVDLFIEIATRVLKSTKTRDYHFIWVGAGYNPDADFGYSVYLRDQLRRAKVEDRVSIVPPTTEIELAYELSDLLLLSSRLDPLPNVAIDSMCLGLPVVCFDRASGVAPLLTANGLGAACVADYLDAHEMAEKVIQLGTSKSRYAHVSEQTRRFAATTFDLDAYVRRVEALGLTARARAANAATDIAEIVSAGTLRSDFFQRPGARARTPLQLAEDFTVQLGRPTGMRKPEPGFDPFVYAGLREDVDRAHDPYAAFIRAGRPEGPWLQPVLEGGIDATQNIGTSSLASALHIHAYYHDGLSNVISRLKQSRSRPDLFVTVSDEKAAAAVHAILADYDGRVASVRSVPNKGRDIGALLTEFGRRLVDEYAVIGHVHLKRSSHLRDDNFVFQWTDFALENVIGGQKGGAMVDLILAQFQTDDRLGIVFPDDPHIIGWTRNYEIAAALARKMGHDGLPDAINFPVGTMFWMRSDVLRSFVDLGFGWDDYPSEPIDDDGTSLHALERLFGVIPCLEGWGAVVTNIRGVTR